MVVPAGACAGPAGECPGDACSRKQR